MPDRSKAPKSKDILKFNLPEFDSFKLSSGLVTYFVQKTDLPLVRLTLIVYSGTRMDPQNKKGLSNLLSLCIDEGAGNLNALQLAEEFDLKGASFTINTSNDITTLNLLTLTEYFEDTLKLLADIILLPHFKQNDFERERNKVITKILQLKDDPDYIANSSFEYLLFGNDNSYAYPSIGFKDDLLNITSDNLKRTHSDFFSPENSDVVVAGNVEPGKLKILIEKYFGSWINSFRKNSFTDSGKEISNAVYVIDKKDSVQTEIRVGHLTTRRNPHEYFKKLLLNNIFGGQFTSRINLNLREKHGYTYGASSAFNYYRDNAFFYVSTSVGIENTSSALHEIFNELEGVRNGISEEELQFAKSSIVKKFPSNFETYGQLVSNYVNKLVYKLPEDYLETYIENVNNVSLKDLNTASQTFIHPDRMLTVLVGDKQLLSKQLSNGKFGEVIFLDFDELFEKVS